MIGQKWKIQHLELTFNIVLLKNKNGICIPSACIAPYLISIMVATPSNFLGNCNSFATVDMLPVFKS